MNLNQSPPKAETITPLKPKNSTAEFINFIERWMGEAKDFDGFKKWKI